MSKQAKQPEAEAPEVEATPADAPPNDVATAAKPGVTVSSNGLVVETY